MNAVAEVKMPTKLDLGCGKNKREGFWGVDIRAGEKVDQVLDLTARKKSIRPDLEGGFVWEGAYLDQLESWPWENESIEEIHCSHFVEHLTPEERVHFVNEVYRILVLGGTITIVTPHWASTRAYGDLTHKWPPVSEFWFFYLNKEWRDREAPHNDMYKCDFDFTNGYSFHPSLMPRNDLYRIFALNNYKEAAMDTICTLKKSR